MNFQAITKRICFCIFHEEDLNETRKKYVLFNFLVLKVKKKDIKDRGTFDLIFSLGGNCAAAGQLKRRGLREFSLPFDYVFMANERPIEYFSEGLKDRFKNLLKRENLVELKANERGEEKEKWQYKDTYSEYRFIHLFSDDIAKKGVYEKAFAKIQRRIDRLYEKLDEAKRVLIICATDFVVNKKYIYGLKKNLEEMYPDKEFVFYVLGFRADKSFEEQNSNVHFIFSTRSVNDYDFRATNYEWNFLDNVFLRQRKSLVRLIRQKRFLKICLIPFANHIFSIQCGLLNFKVEISIGQKRQKA